MKKCVIAATTLLIGGSAWAANMPVKAPVYEAPASVVAQNWTGFYVGAAGGYGWNSVAVSFRPDNVAGNIALGGSVFAPPFNSTAPDASFTGHGWFGGFQAGFNWQFTRSWLFGIEADFSVADIGGEGLVMVRSPFFPFNNFAEVTTRRDIKWFATIRPRFGWLINDNLLLFGTGGIAFGRVKESAAWTQVAGAFNTIYFFDNSALRCNLTFTRDTCMLGEVTRTKWGWTAGGGAEYRVPGTNASIKFEYLYVNLGHGEVVHVINTQSIPGTNPGSFSAVYPDTDFHTVKVGVNWKH